MFIGEYNHSIDEKGRVAIPIKFRNHLAEGAIITRGLDKSLFLYPKNQWQKLAKQLVDLPITKQAVRAFERFLLSGAMEVDIDRQGRIILPIYLRKFAKIQKSVIIAGLYNRIEIWDESLWQAYQKENETKVEQTAEQLIDIGI